MLLIEIKENDPTPMYRQVVHQIWEQIASGELKPGDRLPSVRELSRFLGINVNTVQKAYQGLKGLDLVTILPARGAVVSKKAEQVLGSRENEKLLERAAAKLLREAYRLGFDREKVLRVLNALPPPI